MSRRRRTRVVELTLLAALLGAVAWVVQLQRRQPAPAGPVDVGPGPAFRSPARLSIPSGQDSVVLTNTGDDYVIVHPVRDRADPLFVAEVLRSIGTLTATRVLTGGAGGAYGLEGPGPTMRVTSAEGHTWALRLGDEEPTGSLVYARVGGPSAPPFLLDRFTVRKYFLPKLQTVRDPSPTALRPGPLDSVVVLVPGREFRAVRLDRDLWQLRVPAGLHADPAALNPAIRHLRDPNILDYPSPAVPLSTLGLDPPRAVWILCQGARQDTVRVGHGTPDQRGVFILPARRRAAAVLSSERFPSLVSGWPGLVDRHLLRLAIDSVDVVEFPGSSVSFRREQGVWRRHPAGTALERASALEQDLTNLAALRWTRYPLPEDPPPRAAARLAVRLATSAAAETLILAAPAESLGWGRATHARRWGRSPGIDLDRLVVPRGSGGVAGNRTVGSGRTTVARSSRDDRCPPRPLTRNPARKFPKAPRKRRRRHHQDNDVRKGVPR